MIEKLEAGKTYLTTDCSGKVTVLFVGESHIFCRYEDKSEGSMRIDYIRKHWSELPKPKKRYWLWDVGSPPDGSVFKSSAYLNEEGQTTNGIDLYEKEQLLKKHESEFIDIEEN